MHHSVILSRLCLFLNFPEDELMLSTWFVCFRHCPVFICLQTYDTLPLSISNCPLLLNKRGLDLVLAILSCLSSLSFLLEVMDRPSLKDFLDLHAEAKGVLSAHCMPFSTRSRAGSYAIWNRILAVVDPPVCLLMLPPVSLSIMWQQLSLDHFANTYTHHHVPHVRHSPSTVIWPTYKPTKVSSAFFGSVTLTVPSKKYGFCGFGLGRKHSWSFTGFASSITKSKTETEIETETDSDLLLRPLCSAEPVTTRLAQGLMHGPY